MVHIERHALKQLEEKTHLMILPSFLDEVFRGKDLCIVVVEVGKVVHDKVRLQ